MKKEALAGGQPRSNASNPGFTLVELVIGGVLSSLVIGSIAVVAVNQIKVAERVVILNSINRNTRRVADLLKTEADEACLISFVSIRTSATPPDTPCRPDGAPTHCTSGIGLYISHHTKLFLLVPIQKNDNTIEYANIEYYLSSTELRRTGPQVDTDGQLLPGTNVAGSIVMSNLLSPKFQLGNNCSWVRFEWKPRYKGRSYSARSITLRANSFR